jgi:tetratricopeptide (TPR) repeat protein
MIQEQAYKLAQQLMGLIIELGDSNQVDEAFYNLAPILGERPSYLLAEMYYYYEKYESAKAEFLSLLEISNNYPLVYYYLGKTCWALGDLDTAHQNFQQAIKSGLNTPRVIWEKARLHQEQAIKTLKEEIHHFPDEYGINRIQELEENLIEI